MSTLVFDELVSELNQEITIANFSGVYSPKIKPWLYFHNSPLGNFKLEIIKDSVVVAEKVFSMSDALAQLNAVGNSCHLWLTLDFSGLKLPFGIYNLKLSGVDYIYSSTSFLAWCKEWESTFDKNPNLDSVEWTQYPLAVRLLSLGTRET